MELPCRADPDKWFANDRVELGEAVHQCLAHCPWLGECAAEPPAVLGVIAGVLYSHRGDVHQYQPDELRCRACVVGEEPAERSWHGTEAGWSRHRRLMEESCLPCHSAATVAANARRRARPPRPKPELPPAADVFEERRRVLVEAMKAGAK